jgi:isopenicillin N synthase-like dioxygenase
LSDAPPLLDVAPLLADGAAAAGPAFLEALDRACRAWGFFQITGHGIPRARLSDLDRVAREFFALPDAAKQAVSRGADDPWGYYDRELTRNTRDWKEIYDLGPERGGAAGSNRWPAGMTRFRSVLRAHYADCTRIAETLLDAICVALGAPANALRPAFAGHSSFLRLNHYPVCDDPAPPDAAAAPESGHLAVNRHTDAGALTVLYQDEVAALQVQRKGRWVLVPPSASALVVNLGDMLQVWSNDLYRAPLHRVLARSDRDRLSAPFFYNPSYATRVAPLAGAGGGSEGPRYRPVSWAEFRGRRAAGDYADLGPEVQLDAYRLDA